MSILSFAKDILFSSSNNNSVDDIISSLQDSLSEIKHAIANITTEKKRLEIQKKKLDEQIKSNEETAKKNIKNGNIDDAKFYIRRKLRKEKQYNKLKSEIYRMSNIQNDLVQKKDNLESQLHRIRSRRSYMEAKNIENEIMENISNLNVDEFDANMPKNVTTSKEEVEKELNEINN